MKAAPCLLAATLLVAAVVPLRAQTVEPRPASLRRALAANVIVPQARSVIWNSRPSGPTVQITGIEVGIEILEQVATTTLDLRLANPTGARLEAELAVPVPEGAVLRGFTFQGAAREPTAELLTRDEARSIYEAIVARSRDPALLEFLGLKLIRSSVFPVEAGGTQKVRLTYEQLLDADGDRMDYVLPRTESIDYCVPWRISALVQSRSPIGAVYSPSHAIETRRAGSGRVTVRLASDAVKEPGPFRLSWLFQRDDLTASLLACPDPKEGGGYFLLLAGVPKRPAGAPAIQREVTLVLDRSGSMAGEKLEQVRAAALQVLEGLDDGEPFNIIVYNEGVDRFAPGPVRKSAETMRAAREFLRTLRVRGGTNLHDALLEALRQRPTPGCLPLVLFFTDGLPTIGQTSERAIRSLVATANPHDRRVFTFGVGVDVNTPLLDRLALATRATSAFVLPGEDVEVKVAQVFQRLTGPVLTGLQLTALEHTGAMARTRVHDVLPSALPDLFDGDQLVVLGRYRGEAPLEFTLSARDHERPRCFRFRFPVDWASTRNAFVPRLWASRQIAVLTDAIRDLGADDGQAAFGVRPADPRARELVEEIVRLSRDFGILSEYTAFLAREGTDLSKPADVLAEAGRNFDERAMKTRSGWGAINQSLNHQVQLSQISLKNRNDFLDARMQRVELDTVQQLNDGAFYKRGTRWIDGTLVDRADAPHPRVVEVGSGDFRRLAERLAAEGRQNTLALRGEILLRVDGESVLVR